MTDLDRALHLSAASYQSPGSSSPHPLRSLESCAALGDQAGRRQTASDWAAFAAKLQASVRSRLPDPQALMALYGQLEGQSAAAAAATTAVAAAEEPAAEPAATAPEDEVDVPEAAKEDVSHAEVSPKHCALEADSSSLSCKLDLPDSLSSVPLNIYDCSGLKNP